MGPDSIDDMINEEELRWVNQHAFLPEHLVEYIAAVSDAEPYLYNGYLCLFYEQHLTFIGYPLTEKSHDIAQIYNAVCRRFQPSTVSIISSKIWLPEQTYEYTSKDIYYRLDLPMGELDPELVYMTRRAAKEIQIGESRFDQEHRELVERFIAVRKFSHEQIRIYRRLGSYQKKSKTTRLFEARRMDRLVAFIVVDLASAEYAFYMFSIRSPEICIPGVSDLLFKRMIDLAHKEEKKTINLGLGINAGIRHFKEKWGGVPFLPYFSVFVHRKSPELGRLINKL